MKPTTYAEKLKLAAELRKNTALESGLPETTAAKIRVAHVSHYLPGWQRRKKYVPKRRNDLR